MSTLDLGRVVGPQGPAGKSAYQYAVEGGFPGTEAEFTQFMARTPGAGDILLPDGTSVLTALSNKADKSTQEAVEQTAVPVETVSLTGAQLQGYLDSLPRFLSKDYDITVSGTIPETLEIKNFFGSGRLYIAGTSDSPAIAEGIQIVQNNVLIGIHHFSLAATQNQQTLLRVRNTPVEMGSISLSGDGYTGVVGAIISHGTAFFNICTFSGLSAALRSQESSVATARQCTGLDNSTGLSAYQGGIILLQDTPDLLGGTHNTKYGGIIVKTDGTLL